jgi:hypothetical protein
MFGFLFRLVFGSRGVLIGLSVILWVLYNYLVARQPEFTGPSIFGGFGAGMPMLLIGIHWLRNLKGKATDKK